MFSFNDEAGDGRNPVRNERGFVLPTLLLVLVLLLGLSAWSSTSSRLEHRTGIATARTLDAFNLAELGLIETIRTMPSRSVEEMAEWADTTVTGMGAGGSWSVSLTRLPNQTALLRSTGTVSNGGSLSGATRELGQFVRVKPSRPVMGPLGALTTRGYVKVGGASKVSGTDPGDMRSGCSASYPDAAGIHIDDPANVDAKGASGVDGDPNILPDSSLADLDSFESIGGATWEEWIESATHRLPGFTASQIEPSYILGDCNVGDPSNWGEPAVYNPADDPCGSHFPIIYVDGNLTVTGGGRGQGILVVNGDISFSGGLDFYGIVMAKGVYVATGNGNNVTGAVYAANAEINDGKAAGRSDTVYSKCIVDLINASIDMEGGLEPFDRRGWADVSSITGS